MGDVVGVVVVVETKKMELTQHKYGLHKTKWEIPF